MYFDAPIRSHVRRLELRTRQGSDHCQQRLRVEQDLASAELEPPAWPPGALLLVKTLRVSAALGSGRTDVGRRLAERVRESTSDAARPVRGRLPEGANAVVFASMSEALAAYALSAAEGRSCAEWWWNLLWPWARAERGQWLQVWLREVRAVPGAAVHVEGYDALATVARHAPVGPSIELLSEVVRSFGLHRLSQVLSGVGDAGASEARTARPPPTARAQHTVRVFHDTPDLLRIAPWAAREDIPSLARLLLAIAVGLGRQPWLVRSAAFAEQAAAFVQASGTPESSAVLGDEPPESRASDSRLETHAAVVQPAARAGARAAGKGTELPDAEPSLAAPRADPEPRALVEGLPSAPFAPNRSVSARVQTAFGGVFYLVNVALALELYADFSRPLRGDLELPLWDFLAGLGLELFDAREFRKDPLWAWLAAQAGRDPDSLGDGTAPPSRSSVGPRRQGQTDDSWSDWFALWAESIELRLAAAMGASATGRLQQPAVVVQHEQSVLVHFALATHPIELRMAGLDRDPGWIPAAGIDLRFAYD